AAFEGASLAAGGGRRLWVAGAVACAALALTGALSVARVPAAELDDVRAWRAELVAGLRWMRTHTPSAGPWNAPQAAQDYAVLAPWGLGHLIEYHARRATIATNFGSFTGAGGFRDAAAAFLCSDPGDFLRQVR